MSNSTFDQAYHLLGLARGKGVSLEMLQALYGLGVLSDVFDVEDPSRINREAVRVALGYDPSVFRVKLGGPETTDDIVCVLRGGGLRVNDHITQANFPLTPRGTPEEAGIEIVDPGKGFSENEGLAILKEAKLERPTYEHGLRFAEQHGKTTTSTKKPLVIFLHEPWQGPGRDRRVMCLGRRPGYRWLFLNDPDDGFNDYCGLAGVRSRKLASPAGLPAGRQGGQPSAA